MSEDEANGRDEDQRIELLQADDYSRYLLHARKEILFILRRMQEKGDLVTAYFNHGGDFFLTVLLDIAADGESMLIDPGGSAETRRKALEAERLVFAASHDKVKIQFSAPRLVRAEFAGREAFRARVPQEMLRLQRREFYRLTTPLVHPLRCVIPLRPAGSSRPSIEATVIDISGGGLAVMTPPEGIEFVAERQFENCRIELPDVGTVLATLRVSNIFEFTLRSGARSKRAGCQFIDLSGPMLTLIQRYILRVERDRKARETGML
ncbi:MAG TPA: flagellar brake protein [Candidatus Desulfobacillus sp.]|nr:flagellar brake protein [Candidatus Desulfobacillus sp.]